MTERLTDERIEFVIDKLKPHGGDQTFSVDMVQNTSLWKEACSFFPSEQLSMAKELQQSREDLRRLRADNAAYREELQLYKKRLEAIGPFGDPNKTRLAPAVEKALLERQKQGDTP